MLNNKTKSDIGNFQIDGFDVGFLTLVEKV